ncbi:MAG: T9SS type A sorting domain-containing protein [Bacteroidota bacterium]
MDLRSKIAFSISFLCIICLGFLFSQNVFAQKIDTGKIILKPKPKIVNRTPIIKANIQPYKPGSLNFNGLNNPGSKSNKILTVLKVYPNPVGEQLNINLRLDRETILSIKITDLLGNDVVTLINERTPAGEQTKTFTIPTKLNAGIYFLRILAGGEPKVLKISVL